MDVGGSQNHKKNVEQGKSLSEDKKGEERSRLRLQDKELQEMSDGGWCLSMHQPWASLLVSVKSVLDQGPRGAREPLMPNVLQKRQEA